MNSKEYEMLMDQLDAIEKQRWHALSQRASAWAAVIEHLTTSHAGEESNRAMRVYGKTLKAELEYWSAAANSLEQEALELAERLGQNG